MSNQMHFTIMGYFQGPATSKDILGFARELRKAIRTIVTMESNRKLSVNSIIIFLGSKYLSILLEMKFEIDSPPFFAIRMNVQK